MKKCVITGALVAVAAVSLVAAPKAEASSAKYTIKQYRTVKKYKHGMKATFSYQLPQLKGNSAAIKKINKDIKKSLAAEKKNAKQLFNYAKDGANNGFKNLSYYDATTAKITYNKNNVVSFKSEMKWWAGGVAEDNIGSWTYSLKSGKKLTVYDVAQGSQASIKKKLVKGAKKFGAGTIYFESTNLKKMNFVLKKGKVYVYPQVYGYNMDKYFTLPSRYK